ncbi:hypothetical protein S1OALGB6SA_1184 [Olavius algarvensis spirochete endosymbiont]|nr:hypothetical protein S1OALGB6SA_1184 [Olavius algarvensis spirochete endosymbiont]
MLIFGERRQIMDCRVICVVFLVPIVSLAGAEKFERFDNKPIWRRAFGGEINTFPAQGPGSDVYIVAEDRALHSLNGDTGEVNWIYRPGGKLRSLLMIGADGTIYIQNDRREFFAVTPGGTGRWKLLLSAEMAVLPAGSSDGRVFLPLLSGEMLCVSRRGEILWTIDMGSEASASPVVNADGLVWIPLNSGKIICVDTWGEEIAHVSLDESVSTLALDGDERIWAGGYDGAISVFPHYTGRHSQSASTQLDPVFRLKTESSRVTAILTTSSKQGLVFYATGEAVAYSEDGEETGRFRIALSSGAPSVSTDGTIFAPVSDGSIRVVHPDAINAHTKLQVGSALSEPLLTEQGMLIAGGRDWILYAWKAGLPGSGWLQFRGGPLRSGTLPTSSAVIDRKTARKDSRFLIREQMAVSDSLEQRMKLVEEIESYTDELTMRKALPWVDLLLEDLVSIGTIRSVDVKSSHALVRAAGYQLISKGIDFRLRGLVLQCLRNEKDPLALAAGFRALGYIGSDWDGASMRTIYSRYKALGPQGERFILETARALMDLIRYNGGVSDSSGIDLINRLLSSDISNVNKKELLFILADG